MPQKFNSFIYPLIITFHKSYPLIFINTQLSPSSLLNILGVSFSRGLSSKDHIYSLSKTASKKFGVLSRLHNFFTPTQMPTLYGVRLSCVEGFNTYSYTRKGGAEGFSSRLSASSRLFNLSLRRNVASLFYRYYNEHCSSELCVPPPLRRPCSTRLATHPHTYLSQLSNQE